MAFDSTIARQRSATSISYAGLQADNFTGSSFISLARGSGSYSYDIYCNLTPPQLVRDAKHSVADLMSFGQQILGRRHVYPSVLTTLRQLQVEGTFATGTHLITVDQPISSDEGDIRKALYGSYLPVPSVDDFPPFEESAYAQETQPGALVTADVEPIELSAGRKRVRIRVTNRGDRAIQVRNSHLNLLRSCRLIVRVTIADWFALPLHRSKPKARLRPSQIIRLPPRHRGWHIRPLRARRNENGKPRGHRRPPNDQRREQHCAWSGRSVDGERYPAQDGRIGILAYPRGSGVCYCKAREP